ncbi:acidic mammalian chitinase-like [Topomyia yanbarensis]|uniref:acidic mammalian chitinase-like n=1 Tax=Topomyia yanbarensis TaxID=2498891 RepID=UPI00273BE328|nr:acidic mammalian chitinase-like [Topomyia yanbarensis]
MSYLETCETIRAGGWTTVWDTSAKSYYSYKGTTWLSYESLASLENKINLARGNAIGGLAMWDMAGDDVKNICLGGKFTLLRFIAEALIRKAGDENEGTTIIIPQTTKAAVTTTTTITTTQATPGSEFPQYCPTSGFYRDPLDCASFYRCVGGAKFVNLGRTTCGTGLYFDTKANVCNYAKNVNCS